MTPDCVLIQQPNVDFGTFLGISRDALGYSPAAASDASSKQQSDAERFLSCLAAIQDEKAPAGLLPSLLSHVAFSVLIVADERDALGIFQASGGMPFVVTETVRRGLLMAVMTGTLAQWRDAVKTGSDPSQEQNIRACYTKLLCLFELVGLNVWLDFTKKTTGGLICLERK
jgi:hypothetical protein